MHRLALILLLFLSANGFSRNIIVGKNQPVSSIRKAIEIAISGKPLR